MLRLNVFLLSLILFSTNIALSGTVIVGENMGGNVQQAQRDLESGENIQLLRPNHRKSGCCEVLTVRAKRIASALCRWIPALVPIASFLGYAGYCVAEKISQDHTTSQVVSHSLTKPIEYVGWPVFVVSTLTLVPRLLRMHHRINYHKVLGTGFIVVGTVHGVASFIYKPENIFEQRGITGVCMLGGMFACSLSFLCEWRRWISWGNYDFRFSLFHRGGGLLVSGAYLAHDRELTLLPFAAAGLGAYAIDKLLSCTCIGTENARIIAIEIIDDEKIAITITWPNAESAVRAGQFFRLGWRWIRMHPISVEQILPYALRFVVAANGQDTKRLLLMAPELLGETLRVQGPMGRPLEIGKQTNTVVTLSTGSGASPFTALLDQLVLDGRLEVKVVMYHNEARAASMERMIQAARRARRAGLTVQIHLFVTQEDASRVEASDDFVFVHDGRLVAQDIDVIGNAQVFICGNPEFVSQMQRHARNAGWDYEVENYNF